MADDDTGREAGGSAGDAGPRAAGCDGGRGGAAFGVGLPGGALWCGAVACGVGRGRGAAAWRNSGDQTFFVAWGFVEVLPERVTILAEVAMKPQEIDRGRAEQELKQGEKMWAEAGDDGAKYDEANDLTRKAEAELASADGKA